MCFMRFVRLVCCVAEKTARVNLSSSTVVFNVMLFVFYENELRVVYGEERKRIECSVTLCTIKLLFVCKVYCSDAGIAVLFVLVRG